MLGDPEFLRRSLEKALTNTGMVVVPAEFVAEKIVEAARHEPDDLFLDEGLLKEMVS
jgi:succinyl-CoA synthetase alpha subunit